MKGRSKSGWGAVLLLLLLPSLLFAGDEGVAATLLWTKGQEKQKLFLSWNGETLRIEQPEKRFTVLYRERDGLVTGLEGRDGVYWKFEWPKLSILLKERKAAAARYATTSNGYLGGGSDASRPADAPPPKPVPLWHYRADAENPANEHHRTDLPFFLETPLPSVGNEERNTLLLVARCAPKEIPPLTALWVRFSQAAEIIRTIAVRELSPSGLADPIASLAARQTTPLEFRVEFHQAVSESIALVAHSWKTGLALEPGRFSAPKNYRETTLTPLEDLLGTTPSETPSAPQPKMEIGPVQSESSP
ncbi:hypothetical protein SAMN05444156_2031 [Verrucomicrobium sp. GAS474]|nr:hypothetical protein SAMN05444156_2031 [Verrucomicrobium sp. GAS474]